MTMSKPPATTSFRYHPELDGLRACAMGGIVFFHAKVAGWDNAFIALDLFFVLSGFLVAHVVLAELEETGTVSLRRFYARRIRRLLPAAVLAIVTTAVVWMLVMPQPERVELVRQAQAALLWMANWQFIAEAQDYFADDINSSPFLHYWSLSVEEQYYIAFPLLVLGAVRLAARRGLPTKPVVFGVLVLAFLASLASQLLSAGVNETRAYFATDARAFQLLAGAIAALLIREAARRAPVAGEVSWPRYGAWMALGGAAGYLLLGTEVVAMSESSRNIAATAWALLLVVGAYSAPTSALSRVLAHPVPVRLGQLTYGTYLWHWPLILLFVEFTTLPAVVVAMTSLVFATALSALSHDLLERPVRRARVLDRFGWRTVGAGIACSTVAAVLVVPPLLETDREPAVLLTSSAGERVAELAAQEAENKRLARRVPDLDLVEVKTDRGPAGLCTADTLEDCLLVDGDGPTVVLVGDSHAEMYGAGLRRLAEERGFTLYTSAHGGCPFQAGVVNLSANEECTSTRAEFYESTLPAMEPDLVVFASSARSRNELPGRTVGDEGETGDVERLLATGAREATELAIEAGAEVAFVRTTIGTDGWGTEGPDPLECLATAARMRDCAVTQPADRPVEDAVAKTLSVEYDEVHFVDALPVYCPDAPVCLPVLDGLPVWRNANHLNSSLVEDRRDLLYDAFVDAGVDLDA